MFEGADALTCHASRIPLAVSQSVLTEITADDMTAMGLSQDSFAAATWEAVHVDGKQYAVPVDTHPIVLYYSKDLLAKSSLIGDDGLPKGLDGLDNFDAARRKLKDDGNTWSIAQVTADGNFAFRTIYSFLCQQDGSIGIEPPRLYRRAKLSENCPLWTTNKRRPRSHIHPNSASVRFGCL